MIEVAPLRRRAGVWRGSGQEIVCGAGQFHYSTGVGTRFTQSNFFSQFVVESNTFLTSRQANLATLAQNSSISSVVS
jgi:hypothetical protein